MKRNARHLLLDLLLAMDGYTLTAQHAIAAGRLFRFSENSVRVALARLVSDQLVDTPARGSYVLSAKAHELADEIATWRTAEHRVRPWSGRYIAVHCGPLGRSDRAGLRRRQRALNLLGFAEFERGLLIRPDNIEADLSAVRTRLYRLGLEPEASVFCIDGLDDAALSRIRRLWDGRVLDARYARLRRKLDDWMAASADKSPAVAAREAFLIGGDAIRQVIYDPLLPQPVIDVDARQRFFESVRRFDRVGHAVWLRFFSEDTGLPAMVSAA